MRATALAFAALAAFGPAVSVMPRSDYRVGVSTKRTGGKRKHPCGKRRR